MVHEKREQTFFQKLAFVVTFYTGTLLPEISPKNKHWNHITDGLMLGALPIETSIAGFGNHRVRIQQDAMSKGKKLGAVFSIVNPFEIKGERLGLRPVSPAAWKKDGVQHFLVPMDDFGGDIDVKDVKKIVDKMKAFIDKGQTVYVHCKAGKGRSFSFIVVYLLLNTDMDVTQIFAHIQAQRPQVSPSKAQFALIEKFRATYCPHKAPLNMNSKAFEHYRKDWGKVAANPVVQAAVAGTGALLTSAGLALTGLVAASIGALSYSTQKLANKFNDEAYDKIPKNTREISKLSLDQLKAVQSGIESAKSWKAWGSHLLDLNATKHYTAYRAGIALQNEQIAVCKEVPKLISRKAKAVR